MSEKSKTRCETARCIADVAKYGERYHAVYDRDGENGVTCNCERCGSALTDGKWISRCKTCKTDVPAGELVGLFVPHSCAKCLDVERQRQKAQGAVCRACRNAFVDCCC